MNRSLGRRYAPLAALVAVQLLIIALAPSKAPDDTQEFATGGGGVPGFDTGTGPAAAGDSDAGDLDSGTTGGDPSTTVTAGDGSGSSGTGGGGTSGGTSGGSATGGSGGGGSTGGGGGSAGGGAEAAGDTSHCRNGRQFGGLYFAPPCVPAWGGGDNGGATYQGVTAEKVTIVRYNAQSDPAVDAILASQDLSSSDDQELAFEAAAEKFINANYELWGRQIDLVTFDGTCDLLPPDYACLRNDMRKLVSQHKPFGVIWNTSLASPAFDELSAQKVVNAGGWHFDDPFGQQRSPFHYDPYISGTQVAKHVAEYWCKRLAGKPAKYSGDPQMQLQTRKLGLITPSDDANRRVAAQFKEMVKGCGGGVVAEFYYDQDIDRANEQRKAGVARMREGGATTVVCICDGIAPYFLVLTCDEDRYYPEHLLPGTGGGLATGMDSDAIGRVYSKSTQMDSFFGISTLPNPEPWNANDAARVWRAAGNQGDPPWRTALAAWKYYELYANAIQMAGPNLNPLTFKQGTMRMGRQSDGPLHESVSYSETDWTGGDDAREVYWSSTAISRFDGKPGAWIPINEGKRYQLGQWPSAEPALPPVGQRG